MTYYYLLLIMIRSHMPSDERRAATVAAVLALAADCDPGEISTTAIARHMGVTQGALFKHFSTKDEVLEAVIAWVADELLSRIDAAAREAPTTVLALQAMFMAHANFLAEHPGVPRVMLCELQRAGSTAPKRATAALLAQYAQRLRFLLNRGRDQGDFDSALDVDAAATLFVGMLQGLVLQSLIAGDIRRIASEAPRVFVIYLRGVVQEAR